MRLRSLFAATLTISALVAWGCAEKEQEAEAPAEHAGQTTEMVAATPDTAAVTDTVQYFCPGHPDSTYTKPGVCGVEGCESLLGMKDAPEGTVYICPMHADATSDSPGRCATCNMFLHAKPPAPPQPAG